MAGLPVNKPTVLPVESVNRPNQPIPGIYVRGNVALPPADSIFFNIPSMSLVNM